MISAALLLALAAGPFEWKDTGNGRLELLENGKTALVYNYGPQLRDGAPADRRRCCYIFPVLTPSGVSMLDDFPQDHWHHRGLFWAWPVVETVEGKFDLWALHGVEHRFEKMTPQSRDREGAARLAIENGWYAGTRKLVNETVRLTVLPSQDAAREFDVELRFEAVSGPVTLRGSQENGKSYGGFSARFAPREGTVLRADGSVLSKDEDVNPHRWAELEASYSGRRAVLRITPDQKNPGAPHQWCLRNYGFVGSSFPGRTDAVTGFTLEPAKPLTLKFRVRVADVQ